MCVQISVDKIRKCNLPWIFQTCLNHIPITRLETSRKCSVYHYRQFHQLTNNPVYNIVTSSNCTSIKNNDKYSCLLRFIWKFTMTRIVREGATNVFDAISIVQLKTLQLAHNENVQCWLLKNVLPSCPDRISQVGNTETSVQWRFYGCSQWRL